MRPPGGAWPARSSRRSRSHWRLDQMRTGDHAQVLASNGSSLSSASHRRQAGERARGVPTKTPLGESSCSTKKSENADTLAAGAASASIHIALAARISRRSGSRRGQQGRDQGRCSRRRGGRMRDRFRVGARKLAEQPGIRWPGFPNWTRRGGAGGGRTPPLGGFGRAWRYRHHHRRAGPAAPRGRAPPALGRAEGRERAPRPGVPVA